MGWGVLHPGGLCVCVALSRSTAVRAICQTVLCYHVIDGFVWQAGRFKRASANNPVRLMVAAL